MWALWWPNTVCVVLLFPLTSFFISPIISSSLIRPGVKWPKGLKN